MASNTYSAGLLKVQTLTAVGESASIRATTATVTNLNVDNVNAENLDFNNLDVSGNLSVGNYMVGKSYQDVVSFEYTFDATVRTRSTYFDTGVRVPKNMTGADQMLIEITGTDGSGSSSDLMIKLNTTVITNTIPVLPVLNKQMTAYSLLTNGSYNIVSGNIVYFMLRAPLGTTLGSVQGVKVKVTFLKNMKLVNGITIGGVAALDKSIKELSDKVTNYDPSTLAQNIEGWYNIVSIFFGTRNTIFPYAKITASNGEFKMEIYNYLMNLLGTRAITHNSKLTSNNDYNTSFPDPYSGISVLIPISLIKIPSTNNMFGFSSITQFDSSGNQSDPNVLAVQYKYSLVKSNCSPYEKIEMYNTIKQGTVPSTYPSQFFKIFEDGLSYTQINRLAKFYTSVTDSTKTKNKLTYTDWIDIHEYTSLKTELINGVLRSRKVTGAKYTNCTGNGKSKWTNDARLVSFKLNYPNLAAGDLPYIPFNSGDKVLLDGTGLSIDGMELFVSRKSMSDGPVPAVGSGPSFIRDNFYVITLELPIVIDTSNNYINVNGTPRTIATGSYTTSELCAVVQTAYEGNYGFVNFRGHQNTIDSSGVATLNDFAYYYIKTDLSGVNIDRLDSPLMDVLGFVKPPSGSYYIFTTVAGAKYIFGTVDGTYNSTVAGLDNTNYMLYTPLKSSDLTKIDSGLTSGTISVMRGPVNDTMMSKTLNPTGYRNFVGCCNELSKASSLEAHDTTQVYTYHEKGTNNIKRIYESWSDLRDFLASRSSAPTISNYMSLNQIIHQPGDYSATYTESGITRSLNDNNGCSVVNYIAFYDSSDNTTFADGVPVQLINKLPQATTVVRTGPSTLFAANYLDVPYTLCYATRNSDGAYILYHQNRFVSLVNGFTRFLADYPAYCASMGVTSIGNVTVGGVCQATYTFGTIKQSRVDRILDSSGVTDKFCYMSSYSSNGGVTSDQYAYLIFADPELQKINDIGYDSIYESPNAIEMYLSRWINQQNCTRVITDTRIGGTFAFQQMANTFGTKRNTAVYENTYDNGPGVIVDDDRYTDNKLISNNTVQSLNILSTLIYNDTKRLEYPNTTCIFDPVLIRNVIPGALFDRDPVRYPGIDTSMNPNPSGANRKRWLSISSMGNISSPQFEEMIFHGSELNGQHYYDVSGNPFDGPVEFISFGQSYNPFSTAGTFNTTSSILGPTVSNNEYLKLSTETGVYPLRVSDRQEFILGIHDTTKTIIMDSETGLAQQDFNHLSDMESFHQDIGFTIENLVDSSAGAARFAALGGEKVFGKVMFHTAPVTSYTGAGYDSSGYSPRIPSPAVMPDFFNKLTWRNRILEKAVFVSHDNNWKQKSFIRNSTPIRQLPGALVSSGPDKGSKFVLNSGGITLPQIETYSSVKF
jgi:hypothetical protein